MISKPNKLFLMRFLVAGMSFLPALPLFAQQQNQQRTQQQPEKKLILVKKADVGISEKVNGIEITKFVGNYVAFVAIPVE